MLHVKPGPPNSIMVKVGGWFEASATGWGIVAVPLVLGFLLLAAFWLSPG